MTRTKSSLVGLVLASFVVGACGPPERRGDDRGNRTDGRDAQTDGGDIQTDGGDIQTDGGDIENDGGEIENDGGVIEPDAPVCGDPMTLDFGTVDVGEGVTQEFQIVNCDAEAWDFAGATTQKRQDSGRSVFTLLDVPSVPPTRQIPPGESVTLKARFEPSPDQTQMTKFDADFVLVSVLRGEAQPKQFRVVRLTGTGFAPLTASTDAALISGFLSTRRSTEYRCMPS